MKSDTLIDYAAFQLSPKRSRCELFVLSDGNTEKLASGSVKPFVAHLKVAEEQVALPVQLIKLEVERCRNAEAWFTKGTLERFVRFVSTPEILELVNTFDAEMSQLEATRRIYSQGASDHLSSASGGGKPGFTTAADATRKELLRAIDVRLVALTQDLTTACARAAAAGFNPDTVAHLQIEACSKYISLHERWPDLIANSWKTTASDNQALWSSYSSDMSIDDDTTTTDKDPNGSHVFPTDPPDPTQQHLDPSKQQPKLSSSFSFPVQHTNSSTSGESSIEKEDTPEEGSAAAAAARRLSVQDRISLFESKQKESGSGSGDKPAVTKPAVLRRLSSDVSSGPSAVLRRWSGVSDMSLSLDLTSEKKDIDSPLPFCTPFSSSSSSAVSQAKPEIPKPNNNSPISLPRKDQSDSQAHFGVTEVGTTTKVGTSSGISLNKLEDSPPGSNKSNSSLVKTQSWSSLNKAEDNILNTPAPTSSQSQFKESWSSLNKAEGDNNLNIPAPMSSQSQIKYLPGGREGRFGKSKASLGGDDQGGTQERVGSKTENTGIEEQPAPCTFGTSASRSADIRSAGELYNSPNAIFSEQREREVGSRGQSLSQSRLRAPESKNGEAIPTVQYKGSEVDLSEKQFGSSVSKLEETGIEKMKFQTKNLALEQMKKSQGRREESNFGYANSKDAISDKSATEGQDSFSLTKMAPLEQVQRGRQSKGNQELNDELQMKAHELEKLFAEHKLRVPENQSNSARRRKPTDTEIVRKQVVDRPPSEFSEDCLKVEALGGFSDVSKLNATPVIDMVNGQDFSDALKQNVSGVGFSYDSRGKFYEIYMKKRNERLREEWDSKRTEKEAKMKAMHDNLERNSAEMKVKLSGSADSRRAERLRSFNNRSSMKRQQPLDFGQSDEDDYASEFVERKTYGFDKSLSESSFGNGVSRSSQNKKPLPNRTAPTSTPRNSAAPIPRSAAKASGSGRRKMQAENPLAQSVPNFSDLRKENTNPSSAATKTATRTQTRNFLRSKNSNEESKPFLRKNNGIGPGVAKMKASMVSEPMNNGEEYGVLASETEDRVNDEEDDVSETMTTEEQAGVDQSESRLSQESDRLMNSGLENGDALQSFFQVAEMPTSMPSTFHSLGNVQDSPTESPMSWNYRTHHPFSYPHEASDVDVSAYAPIGIPALWNMHSLNQTEAKEAQMRKKWGSTQKPNLGPPSSANLPRKDVTKEFKRLLKFGRKSRGTDSLVDWISATTSEGDDDTEDGRDIANRSSEDLRKSRMGFSQGHPSEDSFNESEFYCEQVQALHSSISAPPDNYRLRDDHLSGSLMKAPRSFFSLSSFRSKGNDSRPR